MNPESVSVTHEGGLNKETERRGRHVRNESMQVADIEYKSCLNVICKLQGLLGSAL